MEKQKTKTAIGLAIEKQQAKYDLHRKVCDDPLMYTKEDRLKNSNYCVILASVIEDLKQLQANEEKEQIIEAHNAGQFNGCEEFYRDESEKYYKQTFENNI